MDCPGPAKGISLWRHVYEEARKGEKKKSRDSGIKLLNEGGSFPMVPAFFKLKKTFGMQISCELIKAGLSGKKGQLLGGWLFIQHLKMGFYASIHEKGKRDGERATVEEEAEHKLLVREHPGPKGRTTRGALGFHDIW